MTVKGCLYVAKNDPYEEMLWSLLNNPNLAWTFPNVLIVALYRMDKSLKDLLVRATKGPSSTFKS